MDKSDGLWKWLCSQVTIKALVYLLVILFLAGSSNVLPPPISAACGLAASIIITILVIWSGVSFGMRRGSYIEDRYPEELDRIADIFEKTADGFIRKKYDRKKYDWKKYDDRIASLEFELYLYRLYSRDFEGLQQECLAKSGGKADDEFLFYLLAKKADCHASAYYASADDYARADESFRQALALRPETFLLQFRLAEVSERLGAGPEAIAAYEKAIVLSPENPRIKKYLSDQIQRVRKYGPRKPLAVQGITYGSV